MSEQPPEDDLAPRIGPPTVDEVVDYIGAELSATRDQVVGAWRAEKAHQRSVCRVPADDEVWDDDLREALCRRVAVNLAVRKLPLGVASTVADTGVATARVGGRDAEVQRLERSHRKRKPVTG